MEDLDTERTRPGAADSILYALEAFHLFWDGPVLYQSSRTAAYASAFDKLRETELIYPCACSRKVVASVYRGTCSGGLRLGAVPRSWRIRVSADFEISFIDRICGRLTQRLANDCGDFILKRADGPFAYQLAVVVDDAAQGVTDVVRGADLLDNTPRQIYLQRLLGFPTPAYAHVRVARDEEGRKLSKSSGAAALNIRETCRELRRALLFLGQEPQGDTPGELLRNAIGQWTLPPTNRNECLAE